MSVTVTSPRSMSRWSFFWIRLATSVPPTPPPRITMRFTGLPSAVSQPAIIRASVRLLDDNLVEPVAGGHADEPMPRLRDPLRDVHLRAAVGRQHDQDVARRRLADAADQFHERARAEAAARVDRPGDRRGGEGI